MTKARQPRRATGLDRTVPAVLDLDALLDHEKHAALRRDLKRWVCDVLLPTRLPGVTVNEVKDLEEVGTMLTENTLDWTARWRMEGREEGRKEGRREGRRDGRKEGEAVLFLRLAERKFGPLPAAARRRVESASAEQLLAWAERLLTAPSLAEVFDGEG